MVLTLTNSEITERLAGTLLTAPAQVSARLEDVGLMPFAAPCGGMFYWARMPHSRLSATAIGDQALKEGIWLAPGEFFHVSQPQQAWFRFNVAFSDVAKLSDSFMKLALAG